MVLAEKGQDGCYWAQNLVRFALAQVRGKSAVCFAHFTNQMGTIESDFEKGHDDSSQTILQVVAATSKALALSDST